jgi:hypothetical protein
MFAIFLSSKMDPFYEIILSFPVVIFSVLLILCLLFWLIAILGMLDISLLDVPDIELGSDVGDEGASTPDAVAGIILRFGLNGVPLTVIITLVALIGWFVSYYIVHFIFVYIPEGLFIYIAGLLVLISTLYISVLMTARIIKPLRPFFKKIERDIEKLVMGRTATVRTSRVDESFGEVSLEDGGAGLILKVRSSDGVRYEKGEQVVLIEYLKEINAFRVVSEKEFTGL